MNTTKHLRELLRLLETEGDYDEYQSMALKLVEQLPALLDRLEYLESKLNETV